MKTASRMVLILSFCLLFVSFGFQPAAFADEGEKKAKKVAKKDKDEEESFDPDYDQKNYPESLVGDPLFSYTSISLHFDTMLYRDVGKNFDIEVFTLEPRFSVGFLKRWRLSGDVGVSIMTGDETDFVFDNFGLGVAYTVFNTYPVVITPGVYFKVINQSLQDTFSADVFYTRPYLATGIVVLPKWVYLSPYVGVPMYFDINDDNDNSQKLNPNPPKTNPRNLFATPGKAALIGVDYGIPLTVTIWGPWALTFEPSGVTWFADETDTILYVTPGIMMKGSRFQMGAGVKVRVYPGNWQDQERFNIIFNGGVTF